MIKKGEKSSKATILRNEVYQSNPLIEARKDFDLMGMKLFFLGLQGLNPHFSTQDKFFDREFKEIFISTAELTAMFGNTWYLHEIKAACKKLFKAAIEVDYPEGGFALCHLFRKIKYVPAKGLYLWFDDLLRPYILDLLEARGYTQIDIRTIFKLSSTYAIRLLELMLQYQNFKEFKIRHEIKREIRMEELRFMLNVPESAYQGKMSNFRRFVLDTPIREINERTLYEMSYQTVKSGRKVVAFEFKLDTSKISLTEVGDFRPHFGNDAIEALRALGFSEKVARAIFGKCSSEEDCFSRINRAQALLNRSRTPIENKYGFLRRAIEENWKVEGGERYKVKRKPVVKVSKKSAIPVSLAEIFAPVAKVLQKTPPATEETESPPPVRKSNKYNLPETVIQSLTEWIKSDVNPETVNMVLSSFNLDIEQFKREFMAQ